MGDRYHIIITGEDGRSSTFQFSRHKFFLGAALCTVVFVGACILGLTASSLISSSRQLDRKVEKLKTELARKEKAAAIYQAQVAKLEQAKEEQLENLSANVAKQIEDWLRENPEWFAPRPGQVRVPYTIATPAPPLPVAESDTVAAETVAN